jgi:hypothetical protein
VITRREVVLLLIGVLITVILFAANNHFVVSKQRVRMGSLDLQSVIQERHRQLDMAGLKPNATDAERAALINKAREFTLKVDAAMKQVSAGCDCILLNRAALIGAESVPDYTPELRRELGMEAPK